MPACSQGTFSRRPLPWPRKSRTPAYAPWIRSASYDDPTPPVPETEAGGDPNPTNRLASTCFVCGSVTSSNLIELVTSAGNGDRVP
jgi:hypothetical protein